jgi:hypothetical protein
LVRKKEYHAIAAFVTERNDACSSNSTTRLVLFDNKTRKWELMSSEQSVTVLREQAMAALRESTTMLEVASNLLDAGNREEAVRLKEEARAKRNVSVWLMGKANTLENAKFSEVRSQLHETHGNTFH